MRITSAQTFRRPFAHREATLLPLRMTLEGFGVGVVSRCFQSLLTCWKCRMQLAVELEQAPLDS